MEKNIIERSTELFGKTIISNEYTLTLSISSSPISILSISSNEQLSIPWRYDITFTSSDKSLSLNDILSQSASLTFTPTPINPKTIITSLSSLDKPAVPRTIYGVVTHFSQTAVNKDEAHYQVTLQPRVALLGNHHASAIYQNQSVVDVVDEVLRKHGLTGVDFRFELYETYPVRELITQWQESDLAFILRLLADVGIWCRFESHEKHNCDVLVMSDSEQGFVDVDSTTYQLPSGTVDSGKNSVWDMALHTKTVTQLVLVQDYNYRQAQTDMHSEANTQPKDTTLHGTDYRYGEHYKTKGDVDTVESGSWYAKIRHQSDISQQIIISGKSNDYHLVPGQRIRIKNHPLAVSDSFIVLTVSGQGDRTNSYENTFTAIPYDVLKPYRPTPISWPNVSGTIPARVTSPDNDTYGYLDIHGRYRVKFDFDLKTWKKGSESLWVRLAKPYAGDTYGFHFPLIDGTEVAIAFMGGNPDRPYISHAMHDSAHQDPISTQNKHRNVIRTPANNKLRMDDKRGQEHIKLATEYGKTQLNLGHLVDQEKTPRGEGFELRTDEFGAIRAGKGLFISADEQHKAHDLQINMKEAVRQLEQTIDLVSALQSAAAHAKAELADLETQKQLFTDSIQQLQEAGILLSAPKGIAHITPKSIQLSSGENLIATSRQHMDISVLKKFTLAAGEVISLFSQKLGIKLFASQGKVDIQAQQDEISLNAAKDVTITSQLGKTIISAKDEIILTSGGAYIKIGDGNVEIGAPGNIVNKSAAWMKLGSQSFSQSMNEQSQASYLFNAQLRWEEDNTVAKHQKVRLIRADNTEIELMTDHEGRLPQQNSLFVEPVKIILEKNKKS